MFVKIDYEKIMTTQPPAHQIDAIHILDKNILVLKNIRQSSRNQYLVNDVPLPLKEDATYQNVIIPFSDKDNIQYRNTFQQVDHYVDKFGNKISIGDYGSTRNELYSQFDGDYWRTLDDEYAHKKFMETYTAEYVTCVTITDVVANIIECQYDTGSKYITPVWSLISVPQKDRIYVLNFDRFCYDTFIDLIKDTGLNWDNTDRLYLRFCKIEGKYAFDDNWESKKPIHGGLEYLNTIMEETKKELVKIVSLEKAKKFGSDGAPDWVHVLNELIILSGYLGTNNRSKVDWSTCKTIVNKLIDNIGNSVTKS
jgi:hypothetical protein